MKDGFRVLLRRCFPPAMCFAGSEKKAIFISTVLSSNYGERACRGTGATVSSALDASVLLPRAIGLFGDSKPFNVAVRWRFVDDIVRIRCCCTVPLPASPRHIPADHTSAVPSCVRRRSTRVGPRPALAQAAPVRR